MCEKSLRPFPGAMLNPKIDPIFKSLFTNDSREANEALKDFLSAILGQVITEVAIGQNELPIESERDKQAIFDLTCKTDNGKKVINVEMQGKNDLNSFDNRSEYHVAHLLNHFVKKGTKWNEVPDAVMISVLNFVYDENLTDGFLEYTMRLKDGTGLKSSKLKIIFIELPKYEEISDMPLEKLTPVQKWAKFFLYANRKEKIEYVKMLADSEDGIMYAQTVLDSISQSDAEWRRERDYIDIINTELTIRAEAQEEGREQGLQEGHKKGLEQGLAEGVKQGLAEGVKQGQKEATISFVKKLNSNGLSSDLIAKYTDLSVDEVNSILSQN